MLMNGGSDNDVDDMNEVLEFFWARTVLAGGGLAQSYWPRNRA